MPKGEPDLQLHDAITKHSQQDAAIIARRQTCVNPPGPNHYVCAAQIVVWVGRNGVLRTIPSAPPRQSLLSVQAGRAS